ncbi:MAG: MFS transporter [Alphaproteobacteria bacterium]|nr:MFS transporter [Alphaproteobacteria bacterium]
MTDAVRTPVIRPLSALAASLLLLAAAVDELCSAAPTVGAPDLRADLSMSVTGVYVFGTVLPLLAALVIEPALVWLSDGPRRRAILLGSGASWSLGYVVCALARSPWVLSAGLAVVFVAAGVALAVARSGLVAGSMHVERVLVRWTLAGAVGDLLGPLALAGLGALGGGWRAGMVGCAVAVALWVAGAVAVPLGSAADGDEEDEGEEGTPWAALRDRRLLAWLLGVSLCALLDEILVAGVALYGVEGLGTGWAGAGLLVACEMTGAVVGLWAFERLGAPRSGMLPACLLSLVGLWTAVAAPNAPLAGLALFVSGLGTGPQYPLALSAAHRALPGRPGAVEALKNVFTPLDLLFPLAFGALADHAGLGVALVALGLQPAGLIAIRAWSSRSSRSP